MGLAMAPRHVLGRRDRRRLGLLGRPDLLVTLALPLAPLLAPLLVLALLALLDSVLSALLGALLGPGPSRIQDARGAQLRRARPPLEPMAQRVGVAPGEGYGWGWSWG